jgi:hypothetical protein
VVMRYDRFKFTFALQRVKGIAVWAEPVVWPAPGVLRQDADATG